MRLAGLNSHNLCEPFVRLRYDLFFLARSGYLSMLRLRPIFLLPTFCAGLFACAEDLPYQYISLENSMTVKEYGRSTLIGSGSPDLIDHKLMPIQYELVAAKYDVIAQTDLESHVPAIVLSVDSRSSSGISFEATGPACNMFADSDFDPGQSGYSAGSIRLVWVGRPVKESCADKGLPSDGEMNIVVRVFGEAGLVGQHSLKFLVENNGIQRWYDGP